MPEKVDCSRTVDQAVKELPADSLEILKMSQGKNRRKDIIEKYTPEIFIWAGRRINEYLEELEIKLGISLGCQIKNGRCPEGRGSVTCIKLFRQCK